jgi:hypothetical protein
MYHALVFEGTTRNRELFHPAQPRFAADTTTYHKRKRNKRDPVK